MTWGCKWRHAPEARAEDLGDFEESQWGESCRPKKKGDFRLLAEALWRVCTWWGGENGKVSIERMCISLLMSKNLLNSKVIKSFVPELRSRKCFSCFEIPMFYVYMLWTFYVRFAYPRIMGILHLHWLKYHRTKSNQTNQTKSKFIVWSIPAV